MSTLVAKMTEPCYALVHDDDKLDALFEEDPGLAQVSEAPPIHPPKTWAQC